MRLAPSRDLTLRAKRHAGAIVGLCALAYFGFHLLAGERGVRAWVTVGNELEVVSAALEVSRAEQEALEHQVALLRPDSLDIDMLDEQARSVLGYVRPDELVVFEGAIAE
ncbi:MAG: septum formation initiator family protein [Alphaproteobacteria bacterium]|nr:septum formation initiator family protein [Alphaproteobacteria bacterium]